MKRPVRSRERVEDLFGVTPRLPSYAFFLRVALTSPYPEIRQGAIRTIQKAMQSCKTWRTVAAKLFLTESQLKYLRKQFPKDFVSASHKDIVIDFPIKRIY